VVSSLQVLRSKFRMHSSLPCVLHAPPIASPFILSPRQYFLKRTSYESSHLLQPPANSFVLYPFTELSSHALICLVAYATCVTGSRSCDLSSFLHSKGTCNTEEPEHASMGNELMNECNSMNVTHFYTVIYYYFRLSLNTCPRIKREPRRHVTHRGAAARSFYPIIVSTMNSHPITGSDSSQAPHVTCSSCNNELPGAE
jgi:hypothetical protein